MSPNYQRVNSPNAQFETSYPRQITGWHVDPDTWMISPRFPASRDAALGKRPMTIDLCRSSCSKVDIIKRWVHKHRILGDGPKAVDKKGMDCFNRSQSCADTSREQVLHRLYESIVCPIIIKTMCCCQNDSPEQDWALVGEPCDGLNRPKEACMLHVVSLETGTGVRNGIKRRLSPYCVNRAVIVLWSRITDPSC